MASGYQPDNSQPPPYSENEAKPVSVGKDETQQLLEQVLEATLEMSSAEEPLQADEMRTLVAVARRRQNEELTVETVMELVQTVLRWRYRRLIGNSALWEKMTRQIAETIFDDPRTKDKMLVLWARLCEAAK